MMQADTHVLWIPTEMAVLFLLLCTTALASLRLPPLVVAGLWLVVPLALAPGWIQLSRDPAMDWPTFLWVKTWSVVLACSWFALCRARPQTFSSTIVGRSMWLLLVVNIMEAVVLDWQGGHYMNAAAGALLCASILPRAAAGAEITKRHGCHLLEIDLPWAWIIGYTVWNSCFT